MSLLAVHVALSLIGIVSGLIVLYGLLTGQALGGWTALFLLTTILTSATGFPLAPFGFDPPRAVGILSLILLAIAVSGAPFLGLLGTVWGVMSTFGHIAQQGSATLSAMAPGVSAALITTVAGLLVAIPSMFGYNWLVHNLRVLTVELDNFAQEIMSKIETEYLED